MMIRATPASLFLTLLTIGPMLGGATAACSHGSGGPRSYSFTTATSRRLESTSMSAGVGNGSSGTQAVAASALHTRGVALENSFDDNNLCNSVVCFTPDKLTGKYLAVGLSIQSDGHGMMAYFGQDDWSSIDATSPGYDFDFTAPLTQAGKLVCCGGAGNLGSRNTYIESIAYLFSYIDATFTIPDGAGAHGSAVATHTVRFVLADNGVPAARRGDLQYKDADGIFKWADASSGALSATRPSTPISMPSPVVNWTNPFGPQGGNQSIPVLYEHVNPPSSGSVYQVTEEQLRGDGHSYAFDFGANNFVMFPRVIKSGGDIGRLDSVKAILENVITQGLPDGVHPSVAAGTSTLYLDGADVGLVPESGVPDASE